MCLHEHNPSGLTRFSGQGHLPPAVPSDFNMAPTPRPRGEDHIQTRNPTLKMTSSKIDLSFNRIRRLTDLADLAELLFPGNRNQQHAFLVIWISLKWAHHHMVPNLSEIAAEYGVSKRTLERVRAKMRRMGLIDHVSRFTRRFGYREGWCLSTRFEKALKQLAVLADQFKNTNVGSQDKDMLILQLAQARRDAVRVDSDSIENNEVNEDE